MHRLSRCVAVLTLLISMSGAAQSAPSTASSGPPVSISISVPPDVVHATSEVLLEIAMTNVSDKGIEIHDEVTGRPWWTTFKINVRDAAGNRIPETPFGRRMLESIFFGSGPGVSLLRPGVTRREIVMLNRIFAIGLHGTYTVSVERGEYPLTAKSNDLRFTLPELPRRNAITHSIAVTVSTSYNSVLPGWSIPIGLSIKNISQRELRLAVWDGRNPDHTVHTPDEFGTGIEIIEGGVPARLTKEGAGYLDRSEVPSGGFLLIPIAPNETLQISRVIGGIFDVSKPGNYVVQVSLRDPFTNQTVRSNRIRVTVAGPEEQSTVPLRAPFIVTISTERTQPNKKFPLLVCQTNISNHVLKLDNFTFDDEIRIFDDHGTPASRTAAGIKAMAEGAKTGEHGTATSIYFWNLAAGQTLCGSIPLRSGWDFSNPGKYFVKIVRSDYPDMQSGRKIEDLPVVRSNTASFSVSAQ